MVKRILPMFIIAIAGCSAVEKSDVSIPTGAVNSKDSASYTGNFASTFDVNRSLSHNIVAQFKADLINPELYFSFMGEYLQVPVALVNHHVSKTGANLQIRLSVPVTQPDMDTPSFGSNVNTPGLESQTYNYVIVDENAQRTILERGQVTASFEDKNTHVILSLETTTPSAYLANNIAYSALQYHKVVSKYLFQTQLSTPSDEFSIDKNSPTSYTSLILLSIKLSLL